MELSNLPKKIDETIVKMSETRDRVFTHLILMDYDWMHYRIQAEIPIEDNHVMVIEFLYFGLTTSLMKVAIDDLKTTVEYEFDSNIFMKHLKKYLEKQIEYNCDNKGKVFYAEELIIYFYNEVMEKYSNIRTENTEAIVLPKQ